MTETANKRDEPALYLWKKTWKYSQGNRKNVITYVILSVIANIISFLQPLIFAFLLNTIQEEGVSAANIKKLILISALFLILIAGFWIFHGPSRVIETNNAFLVRANYKKHLVDGVLDLPSEWHTEHHSGDTIDKIEKGTQGLYTFSRLTFEIIETIIRFTSSAIALCYFNLSSGAIVAFFLITAILTVLHYDKILREHYKTINHAENATTQSVFDFISNITTVIILRIEKIASKEIFKKITSPFFTFDKYTKTNELKWAIVSLNASAMTFFVLISYFIKAVITQETILIGTVYALYGYVDRIGGLFFRFAYRYSDIVQQKAAVENSEEIAKYFVKKKEHKQINIKNSKWKNIHIKNLVFSYEKNKESGKRKRIEHLDLHNCNITIKKGEKIALVGESGSGKTTFLKIMRGLYKPDQIKIKIDSQNIESFENIADSITLIPQDPELFATTVQDNITMTIDYPYDFIKHHMDIANFTEVAEKLPNKLQSNIKEKGVNLSGGEKQRLALARGLIACNEREIILLDEPTSSVDSKNEIKIYTNIFTEYGQKTIISTIHRLHLLTLFDTIYFFENGKITANGTLGEIIRKSENFRTLWKKYKQKHIILND